MTLDPKRLESLECSVCERSAVPMADSTEDPVCQDCCDEQDRRGERAQSMATASPQKVARWGRR